MHETVCRKQEIIRDPASGVSVPVSNSRPYPQRMKQRHGDWNNGDLLGDAPEHVAKRLKVDEGVEREAIRKMRNRLAPGASQGQEGGWNPCVTAGRATASGVRGVGGPPLGYVCTSNVNQSPASCV